MHPTNLMSERLRRRRWLSSVATAALIANVASPTTHAAAADSATATPIKHVIIIIGENRSFDHIFATYKPVSGDKIMNLLSEGIVRSDGSPGRNYGAALQYRAEDFNKYRLNPPKTPYVVLPPALAGGPSDPYVCAALGYANVTSCVNNATLAAAKGIENGLADDYYQYLLTGGTGQTSGTPDNRVKYDGQDASHLPPGPYQLTNAQLSVRRLCDQPGTPLLPDVAAARLRRGRSRSNQMAGLPFRSVPLGGSDCRRRLQRQGAARGF